MASAQNTGERDGDFEGESDGSKGGFGCAIGGVAAAQAKRQSAGLLIHSNKSCATI